MPALPSRYLSSRTEQGVLVLTLTQPQLRGDALAHALRRQLQEAVDEAGSLQVVLDFRRVTTLASEALRPLLSLRRHLRGAGGRLMLCNLSPAVGEVFHATRQVGLDRGSTGAFEVCPDVSSAIASLTGGAGRG
jgi:anti-anti-sigma factor